jgi:hypothetical protein
MPKQKVHDNSVKAYTELKAELNDKSLRVLEFFEFQSFVKEGFTDRHVQSVMGAIEDVGSVQPRITELIGKRLLKEVGETKCPKTKRTVRLVRVNPQPENPQQDLANLWT